MRNMSFSLTTPQFKSRTKTVTRRIGWGFLKPGDMVMGVERAMGLKKGEKIVQLGPIRIKSVTKERVFDIYDHPDDCRKEGFPDFRPSQFINFFCKEMGVEDTAIVNRIEFEYL